MRITQGKEAEYAQFAEVNSNDSYRRCVIDYAERWTDMMEQGIELGMTVAESANVFKNRADTEGITVSMYWYAVGAISRFWEYGEELRRWHNDKLGYDDTGIANPT